MTERTEYHNSDYNEYGIPIKIVTVREDGSMWASNREYMSRVNYNPYTGEKAPLQMTNNGIKFDAGYGVNETQWI